MPSRIGGRRESPTTAIGHVGPRRTKDHAATLPYTSNSCCGECVSRGGITHGYTAPHLNPPQAQRATFTAGSGRRISRIQCSLWTWPGYNAPRKTPQRHERPRGDSDRVVSRLQCIRVWWRMALGRGLGGIVPDGNGGAGPVSNGRPLTHPTSQAALRASQSQSSLGPDVVKHETRAAGGSMATARPTSRGDRISTQTNHSLRPRGCAAPLSGYCHWIRARTRARRRDLAGQGGGRLSS